MSTVTGYIRRLDLDGQIRLREKDDLKSEVVFEGTFQQELGPILKEAFHQVLPVKISFYRNCITEVEIERPIPDFSYEIT